MCWHSAAHNALRMYVSLLVVCRIVICIVRYHLLRTFSRGATPTPPWPSEFSCQLHRMCVRVTMGCGHCSTVDSVHFCHTCIQDARFTIGSSSL